ELSAWYLVSQQGTPEELERNLVLHVDAPGAAEHLSADLTLQYLPVIHLRAQALFAEDRLPALLSELLRRWPLSGVLADVPDAPIGDLDFAGHHGLLMLYAERQAEHFKPRWLPRGPGAAYMELVWSELGRDPALLAEMTS
ncbi:MAG TPA: hypothetical protein VFE62_24850, partial [Gemmataceae bacterium]|nr:hypothetical protein [Gemmataceae bacterium]